MFFSEWIVEQLQKRNWTQSDLANAAGIGRGVINKIINQTNKKPDADTCVAIARGFKMSPITVFVAAGLLPPIPDRTPEQDDMEAIMSQMSVERRQDLLMIARTLLDADSLRSDHS